MARIIGLWGGGIFRSEGPHLTAISVHLGSKEVPSNACPLTFFLWVVDAKEYIPSKPVPDQVAESLQWQPHSVSQLVFGRGTALGTMKV